MNFLCVTLVCNFNLYLLSKIEDSDTGSRNNFQTENSIATIEWQVRVRFKSKYFSTRCKVSFVRQWHQQRNPPLIWLECCTVPSQTGIMCRDAFLNQSPQTPCAMARPANWNCPKKTAKQGGSPGIAQSWYEDEHSSDCWEHYGNWLQVYNS
jgi:hypothetical protein